MKGIEAMHENSPQSYAATKVIAKACNWAARRKAVQQATPDQEAREAGRYEASGKELAEAVEHYEKAGKAGQP
jgi:hypothetical protein